MIRSDVGLTLETSAFKSLYGGQFTLPTQLIKANYLDFRYLIDIFSTAHNDFTRSAPHSPVNFTSIGNYKSHRYAQFRTITEKSSYEGPAF